MLLTCNVYRALPFVHAFTGCNTTSSFSNPRKLEFFDAWIKHQQNDHVRNVFKELVLIISESQLDALDKFLLFVYYPRQSPNESISIERKNGFNTTPI